MRYEREKYQSEAPVIILRISTFLSLVIHSASTFCHRPLSRHLDRCVRMIQKESRDRNGGNLYYVLCHNANYIPYAQIQQTAMPSL